MLRQGKCDQSETTVTPDCIVTPVLLFLLSLSLSLSLYLSPRHSVCSLIVNTAFLEMQMKISVSKLCTSIFTSRLPPSDISFSLSLSLSSSSSSSSFRLFVRLAHFLSLFLRSAAETGHHNE